MAASFADSGVVSQGCVSDGQAQGLKGLRFGCFVVGQFFRVDRARNWWRFPLLWQS